ncbi:MAG: glycosyltransferase family 2 protein [Bacteroidia bacterium]
MEGKPLKPKISIIIVNYNVRYFLDQCLFSVFRAAQRIPVEVIVVDNRSIDGSLAMIQEKYPQVHVIANKTNVGFAKANNQGIRIAQGEYILLLNPDTVLQEDTLEVCLRFMESHPQAGAVGVPAYNGNGKYLPESKRGLPTPWVAFTKVFGLAKLFPKSKLFNGYHLGHLPPDQTHPVPVLVGSFMFIRREVLQKIGGLDEAYFMYGEDIDLSYRINQLGYQNYYLAETKIIHYKGESTRKNSLNYVWSFYHAMAIFVRKHFTKRYGHVVAAILHGAILFRASLAAARRIILPWVLPLTDAVFLAGLLGIAREIYSGAKGDISPLWLTWFGAYGLLITSLWYIQGVYERKPKLIWLIKAWLIGVLVVMVAYALLPESLRFSRLLTLSVSLFSGVYLVGTRWILARLGLRVYTPFDFYSLPDIAVVGTRQEYHEVEKILRQNGIAYASLRWVPTQPHPHASTYPFYLGPLSHLAELIPMEGIQEVIFGRQKLSTTEILTWMISLSHLPVNFRVLDPEASFIIASNSVYKPGFLPTWEVAPSLAPPHYRKKRILDLLLSMGVALALPFVLWLYKNKRQLLRNLLEVLKGKKTWVGFGNYEHPYLPRYKPSILFVGLLQNEDENTPHALAYCQSYLRSYEFLKDVYVFFRLWRQWDRKGAYVQVLARSHPKSPQNTRDSADPATSYVGISSP